MNYLLPYQMPDFFAKDSGLKAIIELDARRHVVIGGSGTAKTGIIAERTKRARCQERYCHIANITRSRRTINRIREAVKEIGYPELADGPFNGSLQLLCRQILSQQTALDNEFSFIADDDAFNLIRDLGAGTLGPAPSEDLCQKAFECAHWVVMWRKGYDNAFLADFLTYDRKALLSFGNAAAKETSAYFCNKKDSFYQLFEDIEDIVSRASFNKEEAETAAMLLLAHRYLAYKNENRILDHTDVLMRTYELMMSPDCAVEKYNWIQVDEAQDLTELEAAVIEAIAEKGSCIVYFADNMKSTSPRGFQLKPLSRLVNICGGKVHLLHRNYRSGRKVFRHIQSFLQRMLGQDPALMPHYAGGQQPEPDDFVIQEAQDGEEECDMVVARTLRLPLDDSLAIMVSDKKDGQDVAAALRRSGITPFGMYGENPFRSPIMRMVADHLSVLQRDGDREAWARILSGLSLPGLNTVAAARTLLGDLKSHMLSPSDLILYPDSSYITRAAQAWRSAAVVFSVEIMDAWNNRAIVRISAERLSAGQVVDTFDALIDKPVDELTNEIHPLYNYYFSHHRVSPAAGLNEFVRFIGDAALFTDEDEDVCHLLDRDIRKHCGVSLFSGRHPAFFQAKRLARIAEPHLKSYRLQSVIDELGLEGNPSGMAGDEFEAEIRVIAHCLTRYDAIAERQKELLSSNRDLAADLRTKYGELFQHTLSAMFARRQGSASPLAAEVRYLHDALSDKGYAEPIPALDRIIAFMDYLADIETSGLLLYDQLKRHLHEIADGTEEDLFAEADDRVVVTTPLNVSGLEFDRVILFHDNDGFYPRYANRTKGKLESLFDLKDARMMYLALSRARKKVLITYRQRNTGIRDGFEFDIPADPSPFLSYLEDKKKS